MEEVLARIADLERWQNRLTAAQFASPASLLLNYVAAVDVHAGTMLTAGIFNDVISTQSFTIRKVNALVAVIIDSNILSQNASGTNCDYSSRIAIDGGAFAQYHGGFIQNGLLQNLSGSGIVIYNSLAVGAHNIKTQIYASISIPIWLRPSSNSPAEFYRMQVVELG